MPIVPFFGAGLQGKSPKVTSQKRLNCYYEIQQGDDRAQIAIYGTPGLEQFVDFGDTPARGIHSPRWNDYLYVVHRGTFYQVDNAGTKTSKGTLSTTSGRVSMADNGTQIMIVDGTYGYIYNTSTDTFTTITDPQFPANPITVTFNNGRFLVSLNGSGQFWGSDAYDGTAWTGLMFATAESSPDDLVRVVEQNGEVVLLGGDTTEFWGIADIAGFPYLRIGGSGIPVGLAARWSVAPFMGGLTFLARQKEGEVTIVTLNGYSPTKISNPELDSLINGYGAIEDATAFAYMLGGHPMYQINFPTADRSWLYDGSTGLWSQLESSGIGRHRADIFASYINNRIVSDYTNGKLYKLKPDVYTDNGDPIALELIGRHIVTDELMQTMPYFELIQESGLGLATGQGSDPQWMMSYSKDGGHSWSSEQWASAGKAGEYTRRVRWRTLGRGRDITVKVRITDPVKRVIVGANLAINTGIG